MRFAINGFGRVGRTLLRVYHTRQDARARLELAAINEIADADTVVHLARYDSNYGRYPGRIARSGSLLAIDQSLGAAESCRRCAGTALESARY
jgi:glyceraldehyde-3-phosphate dehydrogenase/erythrose-4-phosphate dehydrogenase